MNNETTASQPKSIGDDAQFIDLLGDFAYARREGSFDQKRAARQNLIAYLDSRAPAAQASAPKEFAKRYAELLEENRKLKASATIQAAPTGMHAAADLIDAKAQKYLDDHADTENDTGAVVFHYGEAGRDYHSTLVELAEELRLAATIQEPVMVAEPVEMVLYCPTCHVQHVDAPDERTADWTNPPHRSHLCHACGCIWRPSDVPTSGVAAIKTIGKADTAIPAVELNGGMHASIFAKVWGDAGGGDAGRIALANYAFNLGSHSAAPMVADPAGVDRDGRMSDELRKMIEGMSVSVDVSTGDDDAGNRYFGTVNEVMDGYHGEKHGVMLLIQDPEPNFDLAATVKAVPSEALDAFAYFVQPSGFGPFIECSAQQPGSFVAYRAVKIAAPLADKTGGATFTENQLANACAELGVPDSTYESMCLLIKGGAV